MTVFGGVSTTGGRSTQHRGVRTNGRLGLLVRNRRPEGLRGSMGLAHTSSMLPRPRIHFAVTVTVPPMEDLVSYRLDDRVATVTMDDRKANALSPAMLAAIDRALDRAEADSAVVVLAGRDRRFSAGFDLPTLMGGGPDAAPMLRAGFELSARLLSFPTPVVIACTGHAVAMGVFLLLSGDYRVGAAGPFKIQANEVALGMTMPLAAVEVCRLRLAPAHFNRAVVLAEQYSPDTAVEAGFLDRVVEPEEVHDTAHGLAAQLAALDMPAHAASKLRARAQALAAIRDGIERDDAAFRAATSAQP
jgi:enoyl-CoA hydratase